MLHHVNQASSTEGPEQELISLISRVQRNFRANRLQMVHSASSRRSAALAIERFYLKRRRDPFRSPGGRASGKEGSASNILSSVAFTSGTQSAATEQVHLIRAAQAKFRARQHRKKAVRVIETAYGEWKYHAEQVCQHRLGLIAHALWGVEAGRCEGVFASSCHPSQN